MRDKGPGGLNLRKIRPRIKIVDTDFLKIFFEKSIFRDFLKKSTFSTKKIYFRGFWLGGGQKIVKKVSKDTRKHAGNVRELAV